MATYTSRVWEHKLPRQPLSFRGQNRPPIRGSKPPTFEGGSWAECSGFETTTGHGSTQSESTTYDCRAVSAGLVQAQSSPGTWVLPIFLSSYFWPNWHRRVFCRIAALGSYLA